MSGKAGMRLTRAQAEGVLYKLPEGKSSELFEKEVPPLCDEPGALLEVLYLAQEHFGYLSEPVLGWIAQRLKLPRKEVYEAATFYSMFSLEPRAKYCISICDCLACYLNGGDTVMETIRRETDIPNEEMSSKDGLFSLEVVSCLGLCDQAPAIMINGERYGLLTQLKVRQIISDLRRQWSAESGGQK
jgi:NADH-quinone oxidoreductase subunit E